MTSSFNRLTNYTRQQYPIPLSSRPVFYPLLNTGLNIHQTVFWALGKAGEEQAEGVYNIPSFVSSASSIYQRYLIYNYTLPKGLNSSKY